MLDTIIMELQSLTKDELINLILEIKKETGLEVKVSENKIHFSLQVGADVFSKSLSRDSNNN